MIRKLCLVSAVVLGIAGAMAAQEDPVEPATFKPGPDAQPTAPPPKPQVKDPTQPTGKLKDILTPQPKAGPGGFVPAAAQAYKVPVMSLKARVLAKDRAAAVIDVDGQSYSVSKDAVILVGGLTLKVIGITAAEIRIEIAQLKETIVLN